VLTVDLEDSFAQPVLIKQARYGKHLMLSWRRLEIRPTVVWCLTPCSLVETKMRLVESFCHIFSTLKVRAVCSSKILPTKRFLVLRNWRAYLVSLPSCGSTPPENSALCPIWETRYFSVWYFKINAMHFLGPLCLRNKVIPFWDNIKHSLGKNPFG
jgi:hypothetical protein